MIYYDQKKMELDIIDPDAAGIDVGSRSHYVAVGQSLEDVKEFRVCPFPNESGRIVRKRNLP